MSPVGWVCAWCRKPMLDEAHAREHVKEQCPLSPNVGLRAERDAWKRTAEALRTERDEWKDKWERESLRLAACGVAAKGDGALPVPQDSPYYSDSLQSVCGLALSFETLRPIVAKLQDERSTLRLQKAELVDALEAVRVWIDERGWYSSNDAYEKITAVLKSVGEE